MRVARVLLFLALSGAVAHADDAKPQDPHPADAAASHVKVPLRVVRMLPDTRQALLFDRTKGTHVVVEAGQAVEGYLVDSIDEDEVTLLSDSGTTVVLAAPDPSWRHRRDEHATGRPGAEGKRTADGKSAAGTAAKSGEPQPADPYADVAAGSELGTGADGVRVVEAPDAPAMAPTSVPAGSPAAIGTGEDGVRVVEAPGAPAAAASAPAAAPVIASAPTIESDAAGSGATGSTATISMAPTSSATTAPSSSAQPRTAPARSSSNAKIDHYNAGVDALAAALTGEPSPAATGSAPVADAPATAAPAAAGPPAASGGTVLARADVNAALASFGTLAGSIHGAFTPTGVRVDSVAPGSLFAKAGLQAGDLVSAVDGAPLRSLDDAANLSAKAGTARAVSVAVVRAGKPLTLRVTIQ